MGASLCCVTADMVLEKLPCSIIAELNIIFFITRYVIDVLLIGPTREVDAILNKFSPTYSVHVDDGISKKQQLSGIVVAASRQDDGKIRLSW